MNQNKLYAGILVALMALFGADGCERHDTPAGSTGGDSAGNNQPDGGRAEACSVPQKVKIRLVAHVQLDGQSYFAQAYLLDGDCDVIDLEERPDALKVTLVAIDSIGRRIPPIHDSFVSPSPYSQTVTFALPTKYSLELVAAGNLSREDVRQSGTVFIGCSILSGAGGKGLPPQIKTADIAAGKGKVDCRIAT